MASVQSLMARPESYTIARHDLTTERPAESPPNSSEMAKGSLEYSSFTFASLMTSSTSIRGIFLANFEAAFLKSFLDPAVTLNLVLPSRSDLSHENFAVIVPSGCMRRCLPLSVSTSNG